MKRKLLILSMILTALLISAGSTVAYLTDVDQEINVMTLGRVEIDLIEEERSADGTLIEFKDNHPLYPGVHQDTVLVRESSYAHNWCITSNIPYVLVDKNGIPILPDPDQFSWEINDDGESITIIGYSGTEENLEIPAVINGYDVTAIGDDVFNNCSNLISVKIPEGITTIGSNAFYFCTNLVTVKLPDSLTAVGVSAFMCCEKLQNIDLALRHTFSISIT